MPVGPITPGSFCTVTTDGLNTVYPSLQAPSPTMPVIGADLQYLTLAVMNIQDAAQQLKLNRTGPDEFSGALTVDGTLQVNDTSLFNSTLTVATGIVASFGGNVGITGVLTQTGAANFNGSATFNGTTLISGGHSFEAQGQDLHPDIIDLNDMDHVLDLTTGGQRIRMLTAPTGNRILTLKQTTSSNRPPDKYWFEITVILNSSTHTVSIIREGSGDTVAVLGDGVGTSPWGSSNLVASVRVVKQAGIWRGEFAGGGPVFHGGDW